jgi:hypothetical protein
VGALYPLDVYGQETPRGTRYGVIDLSSGACTGALWTCRTARGLAEALKAGTLDDARRDIRAIAGEPK